MNHVGRWRSRHGPKRPNAPLRRLGIGGLFVGGIGLLAAS
jgi:hypothetical protein